VPSRPYIEDIQAVLREDDSAPTKVDFVHLPIVDGFVTSDKAMEELLEDCCERLMRHEVLYVHCWGGHGRTGTLVAAMLGRLYGLQSAKALEYCQIFHDSRTCHQNARSPQTKAQRLQVRCHTFYFVLQDQLGCCFAHVA
jgi:protein tyrosine/serine phosphatase